MYVHRYVLVHNETNSGGTIFTPKLSWTRRRQKESLIVASAPRAAQRLPRAAQRLPRAAARVRPVDYMPEKKRSQQTAKQQNRLVAALQSSSLFGDVHNDALPKLAKAMALRAYETGAVVCLVEKVGDEFFVVESGEYIVTHPARGDEVLKRYTSGNGFGELSLIYNKPRAATVTCSKAGSLFALTREQLDSALTESALSRFHGSEQRAATTIRTPGSKLAVLLKESEAAADEE